MNSLCHAAMRQFIENTPVVLATIMDHSGSAPRTSGARMLVLPDGSIRGTVGGGLCEAQAIAAALELHAGAKPPLKGGEDPAHISGTTKTDISVRATADSAGGSAGEKAGEQPGVILEFSLHGVTDMDMICGGSLTLLLELLPDATTTRAVFAAACAAENRGDPFIFITRISTDPEVSGSGKEQAPGRTPVSVHRCVLLPHTAGIALGAARPPEDLLPLALELPDATPRHFMHKGEEYLLELFPQPHRIHIFGAGHVSCELAKITHSIGFQTFVLDDRPEFVSPERFPHCTASALPSLKRDEAAAYLDEKNIGPRDGIVIVTRGHSHDRDVLAAALGTQAGYVGMIGSRSKRAGVYAALGQSGFTDQDIARVHSPIGLPIGAETPEEIAVSIAAEIIQWRKG